jgi:hypothetical protein
MNNKEVEELLAHIKEDGIVSKRVCCVCHCFFTPEGTSVTQHCCSRCRASTAIYTDKHGNQFRGTRVKLYFPITAIVMSEAGVQYELQHGNEWQVELSEYDFNLDAWTCEDPGKEAGVLYPSTLFDCTPPWDNDRPYYRAVGDHLMLLAESQADGSPLRISGWAVDTPIWETPEGRRIRAVQCPRLQLCYRLPEL